MKNVNLVSKLVSTAFLGAILFTTGCSSAPRLAESERSVQYVLNTPNTMRITNYDRAKSWLEDSSNGMNTVVKLEERDERHLVASGSVKCNELKHFNDPNDYYLTFVVDVDAKTYGKTVMSYEQLNMKRQKDEQNFIQTVHNIDSQEDLAKVTSCLAPVQSELAQSIKPSSRAIASERFY